LPRPAFEAHVLEHRHVALPRVERLEDVAHLDLGRLRDRRDRRRGALREREHVAEVLSHRPTSPRRSSSTRSKRRMVQSIESPMAPITIIAATTLSKRSWLRASSRRWPGPDSTPAISTAPTPT